MAHKSLFSPASKSTPANTMNEANGRAYAFSPEHALAQYAATGTFHQTYYAHEGEQLQMVLDLAAKVEPEFVAKVAIYCREKGLMKDMPAFLTAYLAAKDVRILASVFPRVVAVFFPYPRKPRRSERGGSCRPRTFLDPHFLHGACLRVLWVKVVQLDTPCAAHP